MGQKGAKLTVEATALVEGLLPRLSALGEVTSRKMFGGHGIFGDGKMFGLVTSEAALYFKADESNLARYQKAKSPRHGKMPYYLVPKAVLKDDAALIEWAQASFEVAHG